MGGRMYLGNTNVCPVVVVETQPTLITKQITENGTYNASSDNADGYSSVEVSVSGGSSEVPFYEVVNGVAQRRNNAVLNGDEFSGITRINEGLFREAFYQCTGLTGSVDFSSLTTVEYYGLYGAFFLCENLTGEIDLSSLTTILDYGLSQAFVGCTGLTGTLDLSSLKEVWDHGMYYAFSGNNNNLTLNPDFSSLKRIHSYGCYNAFSGLQRTGSFLDMSSLTRVDDYGLYWLIYKGAKTIDLSSLKYIGDYGLARAFGDLRPTDVESVDLSSLETVGAFGLQNCFWNSKLTRLDLPALKTIGSKGLNYAIRSCKLLANVYFNSLTTTSFGSYTDQFVNMLNATGTDTTHTLHFPSNLETTIQGLDGYPNFGGTSGYVVLAFDLPATS